MADERLLVVGEKEYFTAVGLAVVCFARAEWDAVYCCERLSPGYINTVKKKTAGNIATDLVSLFGRISDQNLRAKVQPFAQEFKNLVSDRNGLIHANPATSPSNEQQLVRHGSFWTIDLIDAFSDRCVRAGKPLNALIHNEFSQPGAIALTL